MPNQSTTYLIYCIVENEGMDSIPSLANDLGKITDSAIDIIGNNWLVEEPVTRTPPHLERIVPYLGNTLKTERFAE